MPFIQTKYATSKIRVALIVEAGKIRPVWFDLTDRPASDRVSIKTVNSFWTSNEGAAKIMHFAVTGMDLTCYQLSLDTLAFTWRLGTVEESATNRGY